MGEVVIRLRANVATGEREVVVEYESDDDRTPAEHEEQHRRIVERLMAEGVISREEAGRVRFEPAAGHRSPESRSETA